jgi:hypothetical protein
MRVGGQTASGDVAAAGRRNKRTGKRHEGSPGAGRAKLRLSRGLPLCLTLHRQPPEILVGARFIPMVYWGDVAREGFAESPGSGIYLRRGSPGYAGVQNLRPVFTRPRAAASPLTSSAHPNFPLCDLRGLCAMLSPRRMLLAREPARRR